MPSGARSVASLDSAPIESLSAWGGVGRDETSNLHQEMGQYPGRGRGQRQPSPDDYKNPVQPTQSFTSLIEEFSESQPGYRATLVIGSGTVAAVLGRAVEAYEHTASVITGTGEGIVGGVFSISL